MNFVFCIKTHTLHNNVIVSENLRIDKCRGAESKNKGKEQMIKKILVATVVVFAAASAAQAGSTTLKKGSKKISLWCNGGGCYVADRISAFKKGPQKRLGAGGSSNFRSHVKSYKAKGWK